MNNFYCEDFTEDNYRKLLQKCKKMNTFYGFEDAKQQTNAIIMRHDIDFSVNRAVALSQIENDENVFATYFVYLHSETYSVLEKETTQKLEKIIDNGGKIGLHFEAAFYDNLNFGDKELLEDKIRYEKNLLENLLGISINTMSFHNPDIGGNWHTIDDWMLGECINVYGEYFRNNFKYCSDSNGYWRYERLEQVLQKFGEKKLHILTHPVWWQKEAMFPYERMKRSIYGRAENCLTNYKKALEKCGRINVTQSNSN